MFPTKSDTSTHGIVKTLLQVEGLAVLTLSLYVYHQLGLNWYLFGGLFLTPDLFMVGYTVNKKIGATTYNLFHTYSTALVIFIYGWSTFNLLAVSVGLILTAHIGLDRFLGFGLKYPLGFKDTHLQKL